MYVYIALPVLRHPRQDSIPRKTVPPPRFPHHTAKKFQPQLDTTKNAKETEHGWYAPQQGIEPWSPALANRN